MKKTDKKTLNEWESIVGEFKTSGQSQSNWCKQKGINLRTFNYWHCKFKNATINKKKTTDWVPIRVENCKKEVQNPTINIRIGKVFIEIKPDFDVELLLKLAKVLTSIC